MVSKDYTIREIMPKDNIALKKIVQSVILEMGAPKVGTAYEDSSLEDMYKNYNKPKAVYYVIEHQNKILGGAGIAQLDKHQGNVCELQKMYFLHKARGKGLGSEMITKCLRVAQEFGFSKCYLETMPYMTAAKKLYKKNGFREIKSPIGNTSHYSCDVWMIKDL